MLVDRYSGYLWVKRFTKLTSSAVISHLNDWFLEYGFPERLRSDGGPQFRSEFASYCVDNNIVHELTSPYNSQANGLAESAVKAVKTLLSKCKDTGEDFKLALSAWRNTPRADGFSPTQMFYGRRQRTPAIPTLPFHHQEDVDRDRGQQARRRKLNEKIKEHDVHAHALSKLNIGDPVHVQNPFNKKWDTSAIIVAPRDDGQSYIIKYDGKEYIRNRIFLRPAASASHDLVEDATSAPSHDPSPGPSTVSKPSSDYKEEFPPPLRRSSRIAGKSSSVAFDLPPFVHR